MTTALVMGQAWNFQASGGRAFCILIIVYKHHSYFPTSLRFKTGPDFITLKQRFFETFETSY